MPQESSDDEEQRLLLDVVRQMTEHTGPTLTQICGNIDETTGELVGTGNFVLLSDGLYVLTAQHVAHALFRKDKDSQPKYAFGLSYSVGNNLPVERFTGQWVTLGTPQDIAAVKLDSKGMIGKDISPLRADRFALNTADLNDDLYFIHGWPSSQSRFTAFYERGVISKSRPHGGWLATSLWPGFERSIHFAVTFAPDGLIDVDGSPADFVDPGGMSGSVVWKTNKVGCRDEWTPDMARIVGLVHRYDPEARVLVATRIEYVKGLLLHILRSNYAYYRWVERGKPLWDDLDDWSAAENGICDLRGSGPIAELGGQR